MVTTPPRRIAVLGGTGHLGYALARRWALAGQPVVIGSRLAENARKAAEEIAREAPAADIQGADNPAAASLADIIVLAVPFASQADALLSVRDAIRNKLLIDATVPLVPPRVARVQLPEEGSAAVRARRLLDETTQVVSAFHNVSAEALRGDGPLDCDTLVFGDDKESREVAVRLAAAAGLRGLHGGALVNSAAAEALTSVMIFLNKHYGGHAGVRITGLMDSKP